MTEETNVLTNQLVAQSELTRKIWKFIIDVATDNSNCQHVEKAKQLLREISQTL